MEFSMINKKHDLIVKCIDYFIYMAGIFGHYDFFTKELWRIELK